MTHAIHRITGFEVVGSHSLRITFAGGVIRTIDCFPVLKGELFGPLRNEELFRRVKLDPEVHTLVWPNGADFDPATLHDWPSVSGEFAKQASQWDEAKSSEAS